MFSAICELRPAALKPAFPLRVAGTGFVDAEGRPFRWRGITAFRLGEMIATGREQDAAAYLKWAQSEDFTVARVLLMAHHLFKLTPEAGLKALPKLLTLAKDHGLAVELVVLADTKEYRLDYEAQMREVGRIVQQNGNAFVEIANEPAHHTQDERLHDPAFVKRLAALLPDDVIVALGSAEFGEGYAAGDYATYHFPRGGNWQHVLALGEGAKRVVQLKKPVVSDEPIGAGPVHDEGRRDNEPARFAAAAALTALAGMGATFHYDAGLQAAIPAGREAECLAAWQQGLALLADAPAEGEFLTGERTLAVARTSGARAVFARVTSDRAYLLLVGPSAGVSVTLAPGWKEVRRGTVPGLYLVVADRGSGLGSRDSGPGARGWGLGLASASRISSMP